MEIWKQFKDSRYLVSNKGNIKGPKNIILKEIDDGRGYKYVTLALSEGPVNFKIHRLVAMTFLENPLNKRTVNHKDGIKTNNKLENLEWATDSENNNHAIMMGLKPIGSEMSNAKLTEEDVEEIKHLFVGNFTDKDIAKTFGVTSGTISNIRYFRTWTHVLPDLVFPENSPGSGGHPKKLHGEDIPIIRKFHAQGMHRGDIASRFGVSPKTIEGIIYGATWRNY